MTKRALLVHASALALGFAGGCHLVLGQFDVGDPIGEPCLEDSDCGASNFCYTDLGCSHDCIVDSDCPGQGSAGTNSSGNANVCVTTAFEGNVCAAGCTTNADCDRFGNGFGCVLVPDAAAPGVCASLQNTGLGIGDACDSSSACVDFCLGGAPSFCSTDCGSSAACAGAYAGGVNVHGGTNSCVDLAGSYGVKCLPSCASTEECQATYADPSLQCLSWVDVDGASVSVCTPPE